MTASNGVGLSLDMGAVGVALDGVRQAMTELTVAVATRIDGHTARSGRTRNKLIAAAGALIGAGDLQPRVVEICARAGVSTRTLYQHFPVVADLYAAAMPPAMVRQIAARLRALEDARLVAAVQGGHGMRIVMVPVPADDEVAS